MATKLTTQEYMVIVVAAQRNYIRMSRIALIVPAALSIVAAMLADNWWLLLGLPISYIGGILGVISVWLVVAVLLGGVMYLLANGFTIKSPVLIFMCFFIMGYYFTKLAQTWRTIAINMEKEAQEDLYEIISNKIDNDFGARG